MKPSVAAALGPWSNLHPPLPRTPRQSQQLLNALTSSFRRELDREHPPTAPSSDKPSGADIDLAKIRSTENHPLHSASHAADKHLRTILDNPLFRLAPSRRAVVPERSSNIEAARSLKDPMVIFDELVASGSAAFGPVADCLSWQMLLASRQTDDRFLKELRDSQAGSRTVSWWFSLDQRERLMFFKNARILHPLCKFMVAEGLHDTIFSWIIVLRDWYVCAPDCGVAEPHPETLSHFLNSFLSAERECGGGMASAIRYYLDACSMLMPTDGVEFKLPLRRALGTSGSRLFGAIVASARENTNWRDSVPADLYENYAAMLPTIMPKQQILLAAMPVFHPTRPDAKRLIQLLRNLPPTYRESWSKLKYEKFIRVCFDALHVLVDAGKSDDCLCLARFLQLELEEMGEAETATSSIHASSEEKALLTSLEVAFA